MLGDGDCQTKSANLYGLSSRMACLSNHPVRRSIILFNQLWQCSYCCCYHFKHLPKRTYFWQKYHHMTTYHLSIHLSFYWGFWWELRNINLFTIHSLQSWLTTTCSDWQGLGLLQILSHEEGTPPFRVNIQRYLSNRWSQSLIQFPYNFLPNWGAIE